MCRILYVKAVNPVAIHDHLVKFVQIARESREYQGDGWGIAIRQIDKWLIYKNTMPIWKDDLTRFGSSALFVVHARSAFRNSPVVIENNMPFENDGYVFAFNGELQGVKLDLPGGTGAEKIFNLIRRLNKGNMQTAVERAMAVLNSRSKYIRAVNLVIANKESAYLASLYNQEADYFTMFEKKTENTRIVCSEKYPGEENWLSVANKTIKRIS